MKRVVISVQGSKVKSISCLIYPGTTAGQLRSQLNLEDYVLSLFPNPDQLLDFFEDEEDLYPKLADSDRLVAIPLSDASDAYIRQIVFGTPLPTEEAQKELHKFIEQEVSR
jgi:hypothetical protein